ncbi:hypothetical protein [Chitinophaga sp. Ak27]|uniref:hypothetical protein n=1 Tax=Chitinophaga sp. Ak27 TaxID=2726116 RepID=UPI00145D5C17|nr:hypothetical protein [Chitinophaga sp. Ak27]NLU91350.1 hypothetical protein [Chitinophaga sp. Ak27]
MRDNFPKLIREILAKRVSFRCSNPNCKKITTGPHSTDEKAINLGVAAHITAAAKGGPRFCETMEPNERKSIKNGIWLCQSCAKLIDTDTQKYSTNELIKWKSLAEKYSLAVISNEHINDNQNNNLFDNRIKVYQSLFYEIRKVDLLIGKLITAKEISAEEKKDIVIYLCLQIAQFTDDNCFYLQNEIIVQCIGTFIGAEDIFSSNENTSKESLETYRRNLRASQSLLKSVDSKGLIDTSKKTNLMAYYNELELKHQKNDFLQKDK